MLLVGDSLYWTRRLLGEQLTTIWLHAGNAVMVHASLRAVGPMLNGPDALIGAILDVIGSEGTLLCYVNWDSQHENALDETGRVPNALKTDIPPFHPLYSRASRDHGVFAEFARTIPGAQRSLNPGASVVAIGGRANWFIADHPLDYGYGPGSPFAKLVSVSGKILMIGAPLDTMSLLHHAEHLARIPGKHIRRMEVPLQINGHVDWRMIEEFDTVDPVVDGLDTDYFKTIVEEFLATKGSNQGLIGAAASVLLPAADIVPYAVRWLEKRFG
ncbi:aminoglycoside 3-N-acetyltransferase [Spirosoma endbachense]|uniref:Aminoglycoside N(3)-acetyltransferase n=1 Tax=Spirosoma endbachense TaxID=2666025 RepID=A0A6P1VMH2_9BACT|nr:aminoglycoside 3-N-acetyltransferase [Spirosoma endbachense]QHV94263.1 aminoglycoside 3-N-acetyltransferase [Spirosoma endbachense]